MQSFLRRNLQEPETALHVESLRPSWCHAKRWSVVFLNINNLSFDGPRKESHLDLGSDEPGFLLPTWWSFACFVFAKRKYFLVGLISFSSMMKWMLVCLLFFIQCEGDTQSCGKLFGTSLVSRRLAGTLWSQTARDYSFGVIPLISFWLLWLRVTDQKILPENRK